MDTKSSLQTTRSLFSLRVLSLAIALACAQSEAQTTLTDLRIVSQRTAQKLKRGDAIEIKLSRDVAPSEGQIAICVGPLDLSAQTKAVDANTFRAQASDAGLPIGTQEVNVHLIRGGEWIDIGKFSIEVEGETEKGETAKGFESRFTLNVKGQVHEKVSGTTKPSSRANFQDLNLANALSFEGKPLGFDLKSNANLTGASQRKEAVRFGVEANDAQKFDLNDYKLELARGDAKVTLGHLSYGNHSLLINNRESRGLSLGYTVTPWFDVSASAMRATSTVGFDDFFGLASVEHRIYATTAGFELAPSKKGLLRSELIFMDAKALPQSNIGQGQIPDAEQSRGVGVRLSSLDPDGRWKIDSLFARSRYVNPVHPELAQGSALVPVKPETRDAYQGEAAYSLVKNAAWFGDRWKTNVRMIANYAYSEPLFKSLGADFIADQRLFRYGTESKLGDIDLKFFSSRRNDNVKTIPTILKTGTYERDVHLAIPFPQLLGTSEKSANAWPQVQLQTTRVHQYTLRIPDGTNARSSFWPDQMNRTHKAAFNWNYEPYTIGYNLEIARQDNRQPERERADFSINTHGLTLTWRVNEKLSLNGSINRSRNFSYEKTQATYNNGGTANIDWQVTDRWSVKLDYSKTIAYDSRDEQYSNVLSTAVQLLRKFEFEQLGRKWPGQVFVRAAYADNRALDGVVKQVLKGKQTLIQTGLSMNF
jgi:hypothetical protein